jgi:hypothetical protein
MLRHYVSKINNPKYFFISVLGGICTLHVCAYLVYTLNIPYTDNDLLYERQIKKMKEYPPEVTSIIVGDSSAGNAIDASLLSTLTGTPCVNLALTGSYGIIGSLQMTKQAREVHPEIDTVIIMHTLDIWHRPFPREGFFETEVGIDTANVPTHFFSTYKWLDRVAYRSDVRWLYRFVKYSAGRRSNIVFSNDYYRASGEYKTYSNGKIVMQDDAKLSKPLDKTNYEQYSLFNEYCKRERLRCIFLNGPMHETIIKNTDPAYFEDIKKIVSSFPAIHPVHKIFSIPNEFMGDSVDHIDVSYKENLTTQYYQEMKDFLIPRSIRF